LAAGAALLGPDAKPLGGAPKTSNGSPTGSAAATRQQPLSIDRETLDPPTEALLDPAGEAPARPGSPNPPASSAGVSPRGNSTSASRVTACLGDDPLAPPSHPAAPRITDLNNTRASTSSRALDHQLRQSREVLALFSRREHQRNRLGEQPAGHEPERLPGGSIQPPAHHRPRIPAAPPRTPR